MVDYLRLTSFKFKNGGTQQVKKLTSFVLMLILAGASLPAFADGGSSSTSGEEQVKNLQTGSRNAATGWVEVLDKTHEEAAKGKNPGEHLTGVVAGGAIGVRKAIHRIGGGAIDLMTFWIPKKTPLVSPDKARLE